LHHQKVFDAKSWTCTKQCLHAVYHHKLDKLKQILDAEAFTR